MTKLEVLDEDGKPTTDNYGKPTTDLVVSMENRIVKPVNPGLTKEYNFTLKATISGGDFTITSRKTLRVVGQG